MFWFKSKRSRYISTDDALPSIELTSITRVYASEHSLVQIHSLYSSIVEYCRMLRVIIAAIHAGKMLYPYQLQYDIVTVSLSAFYTDQGQYIDTIDTTTQWVAVASEFLHLHADASQHAKSFEVEKTLLLTSHLVGNIRTVAQELSSLSS